MSHVWWKYELVRLPDGAREEVLGRVGAALNRARRHVHLDAGDAPRPVRYCAAGITPRPIERTAMQIGSNMPPIALPAIAARRNA